MNPSRSRLIAIAALVVIVLSMAAIVRSLRSPRGKVILTPFEELGRVVAQQTAKVANGTGKVVVWRLRFVDSSNPVLDAVAKGFDKELKRTAGVVVTDRVEDSYDPWDGDALARTAMEPSKFMALLEKCRPADVLVLMGAAPQLTAADYDRLPNPRPKIVAASILRRPSHELVERGVVQVLIENQVQTDLSAAAPETPAEWFARRYAVVTAPATGGMQ